MNACDWRNAPWKVYSYESVLLLGRRVLVVRAARGAATAAMRAMVMGLAKTKLLKEDGVGHVDLYDQKRSQGGVGAQVLLFTCYMEDDT